MITGYMVAAALL